MGGYAWVTLATNNSYSLGALVLAHSLKKSNTAHKLVVLITPAVSESMREQLQTVFDVVKVVDVLDSKDEAHLALMKRPDLGITFTKIHCWRLVEFEKCVFLDADTLVVRNCDELFEREEFSAAPDVSWPDCFNSGVFVYRPSVETFNKLLQFAVENRSFDGGDQGLLNQFFSDWATEDIKKHLPFVYNLTSIAAYSYIPAFKHYGSETRIVHFIGTGKPWLQQLDATTKTVTPSSGSEHLAPLLQQWWDLFCEKVHPNLDKNLESNNDGMQPQPPVEACSNSLAIALTDEPQTTRLIDPCTPYREKDDFRQYNLPYQPFDVKGSSGELLNVEFLLVTAAQAKEGTERSSDHEPRKEESESEEAAESGRGGDDREGKSEEVREDNIPKQKAVEEQHLQGEDEPEKPENPDKPDKPEEPEEPENRTEEKVGEEQNQQEEPPPPKDPFDYNSFFPDEKCINTYLEQNVVTYQPFENNHHEIAKNTERVHEQDVPSLPRFLTIPENDRRQSGNVEANTWEGSNHSTSEPSRDSSPEHHDPPREETTPPREEPVVEKRELPKSKSMSFLPQTVTPTETETETSPPQRSIWKSQPNVNVDPNKKYSMPKLKPILPKQNSFSKSVPSAMPKVTLYTEFLMSADYKDPVDLPKDKVGFVESHILKEANLRRCKSDADIRSKFGPLPYAHSPEVEKPVIPKKFPPRHLDNELYDLAQCKRQMGNKPKPKDADRRKENVRPLPALKPIAPGKDKKSTLIKKRKSKELSPEDGGREKILKREPKTARDRKREPKVTPRNVATNANGNDLDEILRRLREFSRDYQHFFGVPAPPARKTVKCKNAEVQASEDAEGECKASEDFEAVSTPVSTRSRETQTPKEGKPDAAEFRQFRNYVKDKRETSQKGLLGIQDILSDLEGSNGNSKLDNRIVRTELPSLQREADAVLDCSPRECPESRSSSGDGVKPPSGRSTDNSNSAKDIPEDGNGIPHGRIPVEVESKEAETKFPEPHSEAEVSRTRVEFDGDDSVAGTTTETIKIQSEGAEEARREELGAESLGDTPARGKTKQLEEAESTGVTKSEEMVVDGSAVVQTTETAEKVAEDLQVNSDDGSNSTEMSSAPREHPAVGSDVTETPETVKAVAEDTQPDTPEIKTGEETDRKLSNLGDRDDAIQTCETAAPETVKDGIETSQVDSADVRKGEKSGDSDLPDSNGVIQTPETDKQVAEDTQTEAAEPTGDEETNGRCSDQGDGNDVCPSPGATAPESETQFPATSEERKIQETDPKHPSDSSDSIKPPENGNEVFPNSQNSATGLQPNGNDSAEHSRKHGCDSPPPTEQHNSSVDPKTSNSCETEDSKSEHHRNGDSAAVGCVNASDPVASSPKITQNGHEAPQQEKKLSNGVDKPINPNEILCVPDFETPRSSRVSLPTAKSTPWDESEAATAKNGHDSKANGFDDSPDGARWFVGKKISGRKSPSSPKTSTPSCGKSQTGSSEDVKRGSGIAGAIAQLSLEAGAQTPESAAASAAHQEYLRRQNWETGNMDYMGRDSFDNIWSKICQTLEAKEAEEAAAGSPQAPTTEQKKPEGNPPTEDPVTLATILQKCPEYIETLPGDPAAGPVEDDEIIFSKHDNRQPCLTNIAEVDEVGSESSEAAGKVKPSDTLPPAVGGKGEKTSEDDKSPPGCQAAGGEKAQPPATPAGEKPQPLATPTAEKTQLPAAPAEQKPQPQVAPVEAQLQPPATPTGEKPQPPAAPAEVKPQPPATPTGEKPQPPAAAAEVKPQPPATPTGEKPQPPAAPAEQKPEPPAAPAEQKPQPPATPAEQKPEPPAAPAEAKPQPPTTPTGEKTQPPVPPAEQKPQPPVAPVDEKPAELPEEKKPECKSVAIPPPPTPQTPTPEGQAQAEKKAAECTTVAIPSPPIVFPGAPFPDKEKPGDKGRKAEDKTEVVSEPIPLPPPDSPTVVTPEEATKTTGSDSSKDEGKQKKGVLTKILEMVGVAPKEKSENGTSKSVFYDVEGEVEEAKEAEQAPEVTEKPEPEAKTTEGQSKPEELPPAKAEEKSEPKEEAKPQETSPPEKRDEKKPEQAPPVQEPASSPQEAKSPDSAEAPPAKKPPSPKLTMPQTPPATAITTPTPPPQPEAPPRKNSGLLKVDDTILETPPVTDAPKTSVAEAVKGKVEDIIGKAKSEVESLLQDRRSSEKEPGESADLINTMKLMMGAEDPGKAAPEEVEELRVTSEEERKRHKGEVVTSKLSDQILKAIPPPRRKAISEASASTSAIPKATAAPEQKSPPGENKNKAGKPSSVPVPPPRSRGKPSPPKGKGKK